MVAPIGAEPRTRVGLWIVMALLFIRLPYELGVWFFTRPSAPAWLWLSSTMATWLLTLFLIYWERERLPLFHIDGWALLFLMLPPFAALVWPHKMGSAELAVVPWVAAPAVVLLCATLVRARVPRPGLSLRIGAWLVPAGASGVALAYLAVVTSPGFDVTITDPVVRVSVALAVPIGAANVEEPLFRGFLWGYLRLAGWREEWIWLLQAGLFWLGHLGRLFVNPLNFWVCLPVAGLVLGLLAWRSRSIGASIVAHWVANTVGQFL